MLINDYLSCRNKFDIQGESERFHCKDSTLAQMLYCCPPSRVKKTQLAEHQTHGQTVRFPLSVAEEFSSPELTFPADYYSVLNLIAYQSHTATFTGVRILQLAEQRTRDQMVRFPAGMAEFSSPKLTFKICADSYLVSIPPVCSCSCPVQILVILPKG